MISYPLVLVGFVFFIEDIIYEIREKGKESLATLTAPPPFISAPVVYPAQFSSCISAYFCDLRYALLCKSISVGKS